MSYTPTEWKNGDVITAQRLNKIEDGIFNNSEIFYIPVYLTDIQTNHYQIDSDFINITDIKNAIQDGKFLIAVVGLDDAYKRYWKAYDIYMPDDSEIRVSLGTLDWTQDRGLFFEKMTMKIYPNSETIEIFIEVIRP